MDNEINNQRMSNTPSVPKEYELFLFSSVPKEYELSNFEKFKQLLPLYIILFITYTITINTYIIIIMWTPLSTNIISTTLSLPISYFSSYFLKSVLSLKFILFGDGGNKNLIKERN